LKLYPFEHGSDEKLAFNNSHRADNFKLIISVLSGFSLEFVFEELLVTFLTSWHMLVINYEVFEKINALVFLKDLLDLILFIDVFLWVYLYFLSKTIFPYIKNLLLIIQMLLLLDIITNYSI
jgi:hypothetical protein